MLAIQCLYAGNSYIEIQHLVCSAVYWNVTVSGYPDVTLKRSQTRLRQLEHFLTILELCALVKGLINDFFESKFKTRATILPVYTGGMLLGCLYPGNTVHNIH